MTNSDHPSRDAQSRVEFTGPEELDKVLVHLREARERAAQRQRLKGGAGGRGPASAPIPPDTLDFGPGPMLPQNPPPPRREAHVAPGAGSIVPTAVSGPVSEPQVSAPQSTSRTEQAAAVRPPAPQRPAAPQRIGAPDAPVTAQPVAPQQARRAASPPAAPTPRPAAPPPQAPVAQPQSSAEPVPAAAATPQRRMSEAVNRLEALAAAASPAASIPAPPRPVAPSSQPMSVPRSRVVPAAIGSLAGKGELMRAILGSMPSFKAMAWFSCVSNILMLAGPLFMLQVYDRVMTSGSMPTLLALSLLTAAIYGVIGLLDLIRSRIIVRVGVELDQRISERVFGAALRRSLSQPGSSLMALRELDGLRQFIAGPGPLTAFDAPWTPVYMLVIFLTHWTLGVAATIGAVALVLIAWASEVRSRQSLAEASKAQARSLELAETGQRNAESIGAMGMLGAYRARWQKANGEALAWQVLAADRLASMTSLSKALRLLLQSMMLAIGAALAIQGQISAGAIIAATIIFGRALAPVEQGVGQWRGFVKARESFAKLEELLKAHPEPVQKTSLPAPKGYLDVKGVRVMAPESRAVILANVTFAVNPGQMVAVIGPSASGKSTLARTLVGLWPTSGGEISIDGARLEQWNSEELGRHIGYLPQNVELFAGTVRENISRFEPLATDNQVVEAARAAHAHDMIMALPQGYDTQLGAFGTYLSAGQRQRIGLARALFGYPALVVLDEPNANLDRFGDEALAGAIDGMRKRGQAIVLVSHRVQAIGKADLLLYLERGQQRAFGPREDVLRFLQQGQGAAQPGAPSASQGEPRR